MGIETAVIMGMGMIGAGSQIAQGYAEEGAAAKQRQAEWHEYHQIEESKKLSKIRGEKDKRRLLGAQRAAVGASGVTMSGSPLEVINQSMYEFELDQAIEQEQYELQKLSKKGRIEQLEERGRQARRGAYMQAANTLFQTSISTFGGSGKTVKSKSGKAKK